MKKHYIVLSALLFLAACSNSKVDLETMSADEIYNYAMDEMEATRYVKAEKAFETLETDHPYSQWAVRAKLMGAYAYYKDEKYDEAVMALDRFMKYHPGNKDVPYALYLKGMCYYDQISAADKDQGNTQKAAEAFNLLMSLFPDSEYAKDAAGKMNLTEDYKAGQEMIIGRYYLNEGNYLSALNRFNVVLENYQKTIQIEEALYRQVEIYAIFGMNKYAKGYYGILKQNYPDGKWTAKAEKIMKKIGEETQPSKKTVAETAEEKKSWFSGWFSGWFGGSDEAEATAEAETEVAEAEVEAEAEEEAENATVEKKSWFSGWFGGSDAAKEEVTEAEDKTAEIKDEAEDVTETAEEKKSWFSGWFGGSDAAKEEVTEAEDKTAEIKDEAEDADIIRSKEAADEVINESLNNMSEAVESGTNSAEESVLPDNETEHRNWFSGLFSGGTLIGNDAAE